MGETYKARSLVKGTVVGEALVSSEPVCFVGGIDVETGIFTEKGHPLYGKCGKGKVLVFPTGKGSTGGSYVLYEVTENGVGPAAIINQEIEQVTVVGCIISRIPTVDRVEADPVQVIKDGDLVEVDATNGIIKILNRRED